MPITGKPKPFYRPILKEALHHVFVERDAWIFGVLALLIGSGSALETVVRSKNGIFPYLENIRQWIDQLAVLSPVRAFITITLSVILVIFVIGIGVSAQVVIIHGTKKKNTIPRSISKIISETKRHITKVLVIDLLVKIGLIISALILLAPLTIQVVFFSDLIIAMQTIVAYGLILTVTVTGVYAMSGVVNHKLSLKDAIAEAFKVFKKHPATSLEISLLLFAINIGVGILVLVLLTCLSLPYTLFFLLGAHFGSTLATTLVTAIIFFIAIAVLIVLGGLTTTYNYSVLAITYKKLRRNRSSSKISRVIHTHHLF